MTDAALFGALAAPLAVSLSDGPLFGLPLADLWFALLFFLLGTFLFLDGFDFGAGALFATREDDEQRETILAAIGPFWDGNEVWLVVFGGATFAAFPPVYANLFSRHYLLMFAILAALFLRGLAPEMYEQRHDDGWQRWWGRSFVVGSVAAPFLLGVFVGNWLIGARSTVTLVGAVVGVAVVALTVVTGAAFLRLKTRGALRDDVRWYGERAAAAYLVAVVAALAAAAAAAPRVAAAVTAPVSVALVAVSVAATGGTVAAMRRDADLVAFAASGVVVYALAALVCALLFPVADPATDLTVQEAVVSTIPLNLMSVAAAVLLPLVLTYFGVLYSAFSGPIEAGDAY
ncbi:cytochrome d ubiquinol oxidase subunit II [Halobaculum sp. P14]|uniref:cytochrome d ubiquinol oxidase subunit II n=1 Tax=Halobaculum sp. P14 TaxID=3421638 RepID=UPI003EB86864